MLQMWQKVWIPSLILPVLLYFLLRMRRTNLSALKGRCVLITGAGSGLGRALALLLNRLEAKVILCGRRVDRLEEVRRALPRQDVRSWAFRLDLCDAESMDSVARQISSEVAGPVHILINNAGQSYRGKAADTGLAVHRRLMDVNYFGHVALTVAWLKHLRSHVGDCAVFVSSIQGRFSIPYRSAYSAPKHALQAFADALRAEQSASPDGARVLVASPGYIRTELSRNALRDSGTVHDQMDRTTAAGMRPEEVAEGIVGALCDGRKELTMAPVVHRLAIVLRAVWPGLFFRVMARRAARDGPY